MLTLTSVSMSCFWTFILRLNEGWKTFFCDDDILSKLSDNYLMHDEMGDLGGFQQHGHKR